MVGIVIVSHSMKLAESVVELTAMMAPNANIAAAGGLEDGSMGTSFERISTAIDKVDTQDGVLVLMDMGSAVMTTEMVLEMMPDRKIKMVDCPLVEGAVAATVSTSCGNSFEEVLEELSDTASFKKLG
ncbi:MAG: dihydroxyacetone kinase phosphoryl donor subunit DhaM [Lachnospiraceae bacterium]